MNLPRLAVLASPPDEGGHPADEGVPSAGSPSGMETGQVRSGTPNSPSAGEVAGGAAVTASPATECICVPEPTRACLVHFPSYHNPPTAMTREEFDEVVGAIYHRNWEDRGRFPDLFAIALAQLGTFAVAQPGLDGEFVRRESAQAIRRMMHRVVDGETHIETEDHR